MATTLVGTHWTCGACRCPECLEKIYMNNAVVYNLANAFISGVANGYHTLSEVEDALNIAQRLIEEGKKL